MEICQNQSFDLILLQIAYAKQIFSIVYCSVFILENNQKMSVCTLNLMDSAVDVHYCPTMQCTKEIQRAAAAKGRWTGQSTKKYLQKESIQLKKDFTLIILLF